MWTTWIKKYMRPSTSAIILYTCIADTVKKLKSSHLTSSHPLGLWCETTNTPMSSYTEYTGLINGGHNASHLTTVLETWTVQLLGDNTRQTRHPRSRNSSIYGQNVKEN
uniref:Ovule protein n=1 Tax=Steinernema glaseri TaxID=37863 RepID=A0A1I7ZR18_9BILA